MFRSIAPLMESIRCLLFFVFDSYIIVPWIVHLNPPMHLQTFIHISMDIIRVFHIFSIALWIFMWYRTVCRIQLSASTNKAEILFASENKATLIKEDKCISAGAYSNNINTINRRSALNYGIYAVVIVFSITFMWFAFALRFDECNQLMNSHTRIEL